jgi:pimeloyl-ACP methyl ester carboxylesterase
VPKGFRTTAGQERQLAEVMTSVLPAGSRADGALFDMYVSNPDINSGYRFEEVAVPTLVVGALDDPLALYENARAMAEQIPGAEMATVDSGGHLLLGHEDEVRSLITAFLRRHARTAGEGSGAP